MRLILYSIVLFGPVAALAADRALVPPYEVATPVAAPTQIDRLVGAQLERLGLKPSYTCSDAVFIRRVFLDVIGTLPTAREVEEFVRDRSADKRTKLIDRVLARPEYADYWSLKWNDLLRVKAEFPINLWPNAVQAYARYIRASLRENKPLDRFAREMLTASGSNFRVGEVNFWRASQSREPAGMAQAVALTFMGTRAEKWPKEKLDGLTGFFSQLAYKSTLEWKEEIVYWDPTKKGPAPVFPDGTAANIAADQDPREVFANWLLSARNPYFSRSMANRAWGWLMGRGIVHEIDDIRPDNPPTNPALLEYLAGELVKSNFDMKALFRLILNSQTYQRSSIPMVSNPAAEANFAHYPLRRLEAEVIIDALCQITGTSEKYSSPIPEPFTFIPDYQRSIALEDGSITSPFLEMFGRPSRDTGLESERNNRPSAAQRLHLLNSTHIHRKIDQGPKMRGLVTRRGGAVELANTIYLTVLSRYPTAEELKVIAKYGQSGSATGRQIVTDIVWALINSAEFQYRH